MWWRCPECGEKVNFGKRIRTIFDELGEASFSPKQGWQLCDIRCKCGCLWSMSLSGVITDDDD